MKRTPDRMNPAKSFRPAPLIAALACALGAPSVLAATFSVSVASDSGAGSLRQAILDAEAACVSAPHTISFTGAFTIAPSTPLPTLTCANPIQILGGGTVSINGQFTYGGSPCGLTASSTNTRIVGLEIRNFSYGGYGLCGTMEAVNNNIHNNGTGISSVGGSTISGNTVTNNYPGDGISGGNGMVVSGNTVSGHTNGRGIYLGTGATITNNVVSNNSYGGISAAGGSTIRGNTVSGHPSSKGIYLYDGGVIGGPGAGEGNVSYGNDYNIYASTGTVAGPLTIENNLVGTPDGVTASYGGSYGISVYSHPSVIVRGNVIVGHQYQGLSISNLVSGSSGTISNNKIGVNASGTAALPNGDGLSIYYSYGGSISVSGNTISGNAGAGIDIYNSNNITLTANRIGTNASGSGALGNGAGVDAACSNQLTFSGNTISGNAVGMDLVGVKNSTFSGNFVGSTTGGAAPIPNTGHGVFVGNSFCCALAFSATDLSPKVAKVLGFEDLNNLFDGNTVAFNNGDGLYFSGSKGHKVTGGSIHSNGGKSINLDYTYGALLNDTDPPDGSSSSPNNGQNHPVIVSAEEDSGQTVIHYTLNSIPSTSFFVDFYANDVAQPLDRAGGKIFLGRVSIVTDATGNVVNGLASFPGSRTHVTATATGPFGTSEFANAIVPVVPAVSVTPSPNLNFGNVVVPGTSASQSVTLTSSGTGAYQIDSLSSSPPSCPGSGSTICSTGDFSCTTTSNCTPGTPMANGATCVISANFHPATVGPSTASIYICDNTSASFRTITLSGNGTPITFGVTPPSYSFGNVMLGTTALSPPISITNPTATTASLGAPIGGGAFTLSSTTCTATLAPGASCNVVIAYAPTATTLQAANLTVPVSNPGATAIVVPLQGTGVVPYTISPSSWDFGTQALGSTTATKAFTLSNASTSDVPLGTATAAAPFRVVSTTCAAKIPATGTCTVTAGFVPAANGLATGQLTVPVTLTGAPAMVAGLQGTGGQATVVLPGQLDLGSALVGAADMTAGFTLQNGGVVPLAISSIAATAPFQASHSCPASLAPGATCAGVVKLTPTTAGSFTGSLSVVTDAQGSPHTVALVASVQSQQGILSLPSGIDLGTAPLAGAPLSSALQIKNTGNGTVVFTGINVTAPFTLSHNCPASLAPNALCTATLGFAPLIYGNSTGQLTVGSNAAGGNRVITLLATVSGVQYGISPGDWSFGSVLVGAHSTPAKSFIISNNGDNAVPLIGVTVTGPFSIATSTCGASLGAHSSCTADVVFDPLQPGLVTGTIKAQIGLTGAPAAQATLSGTGTQQAGLSLPTTVDFGSITLGSVPTATQTVQLRNTGNAVLTFSATASGPFVLSGNCGLNLAPGAECNLVLTFTPTVVGTFTGSLSIVSNAPGGSRAIELIARVQPAPRPQLQVDVTSMGYGDQLLGSPPSAPQTVVLRNVGGATAQLTRTSAGIHFNVTSNCGTTLAPGARCETQVRFTPYARGPIVSRISFTGEAGGIPVNVDLIGRGCGLRMVGGRTTVSCTP